MSRIHLTTALLVGVSIAGSISGCNCGGTPPGTGPGIAAIISRFANGNAVQSDGQSRLTISLTATNKDHAPDKNPISLTVPTGTGFLAKKGGDLAPDTLTTVPDAKGAVDIDFQCPLNADGAVTIAATNGDASTNIVVRCTQPQGQLVITVAQDNCNQKIQSDGFSTCDIQLKVVEKTPSADIPFSDNLQVEVTNVVPANGATAENNLIAPQGALAGASTQVNVPPDGTNDGLYSFTFFAPHVQEVATLTITAAQVTTTFDVTVALFNNLESVTAAPANVSVTGGRDATITVTATNADGSPATQPLLSVEVDQDNATVEGGGQAAAKQISSVALTNGQVVLTVHTPTIQSTDPKELITLTADFQPDPRLPVVHGTSLITANPQGTLALNATLAPATPINSTDSATKRTATLTVTLDIDGNPVNNANVDVLIDQNSQADLNLDTSNTTKVVAENVDLSSGSATVDVLVESGVPSTTATVNLVGHANGIDTDVDPVDIKIQRPPILTSIQFVSATPSTLGTIGASTVSGSSLPAVSTVTFKLLDDTGQPMSNVAVHFDKNATADRGIGVQQNAISGSDGSAQTIISAGSIPGPVSVIATANDPTTGDLRIGQSTTIAIVNALPSFETSFLTCGDSGVAARKAPWTVNCTAEVVDRFTNDVDGVLVQFFAEAGNEGATKLSTGGAAAVTIASDDSHGAPSPDVDDALGSWSLAPLLPRGPNSITACQANRSQCGDFGSAQNPNFNPAACFDGTTSTPCDIVQLCLDNGLKGAFCPLDPQCVAGAAQAAGVLKLGVDPVDLVDASRPGHATAVQNLAVYQAHFQDCGFPVSCLIGQPGGLGLSVTNGDQCPVNLGCMDFDGNTECPQAGVRTMLATTRGAEAFSDSNGNGLFDDVTAPNQACNTSSDCGSAQCVNGLCTGETFVDLPEPFLDQNDNCQHDDMTHAPLYANQPVLQRINTDFFFDVDGNKVFGFTDPASGAVTRLNGKWDFDTELMLSTHILEIGSRNLVMGEECSEPPLATHTCQATNGAGQHIVAQCKETDDGHVIANCNALPNLSVNGLQEEDIVFRWADEDGNCPSVDMKDVAGVLTVGSFVFNGPLNTPLDTTICGFGDLPNPREPECSSQPALGAPTLSAALTLNCLAGTVGTSLAQATFSLGEKVVAFNFTVDCGP